MQVHDSGRLILVTFVCSTMSSGFLACRHGCAAAVGVAQLCMLKAISVVLIPCKTESITMVDSNDTFCVCSSTSPSRLMIVVVVRNSGEWIYCCIAACHYTSLCVIVCEQHGATTATKRTCVMPTKSFTNMASRTSGKMISVWFGVIVAVVLNIETLLLGMLSVLRASFEQALSSLSYLQASLPLCVHVYLSATFLLLLSPSSSHLHH